jgi:signal transduction histidine kinase
MVPDSYSEGEKDEFNDRDRLILQLKQLQDAYARQAEVIARYERLYKNKKKPKKDVYEELEIQRELIETLNRRLKDKQEDMEARTNELEARNEELQLSLEQQAGIEAAAVRSERDFRAIVEKNADAMVVLDGEGRVLYVNPAAEEMFHLSASKMVGAPFGFPVVLDKPVQMLVLREFKEFVAAEMRLVEVNWGYKPSFLISLRDMTDHIRAEAELEKYQKHLEAEIKERTRKLEDAKGQAELYLDLMSHDINNLHQIALGYLELAREMPPGGEQTVLLDKPVEVLQRSAQLITNVRKLQRLRDGVFLTQDVDVGRVLEGVLREFGDISGKRVTLNADGHGPCFVRANELLHDVFANLVSNAVKHTGDKKNITICLDVVEDNGRRHCRVAVEDDGPGIPDDFKARIFDRTLKGTGKTKGMGLGLYLVKSLVESYGGRVWVEDCTHGDHRKGARFVVLLPAVE